MKYASPILRLLLSLVFLLAGSQKLIGAEMMIAVFDQIGLGQWFRIVTGAIEVGAVVLLWLPGRQAIAAGLLGATMVGAFFSHVFILGPSAVPAFVLGLLCACVVYLHKDQVDQLLAKFKS